MAVKYITQYSNVSDYLQDQAKSSEYFNAETYNKLLQDNAADDYAAMLIDIKTRKSDAFDKSVYDALDVDDQYAYLINEYYGDTTSNEYKQNAQYFTERATKNIAKKEYENMNFFEKTGKTLGGFFGSMWNQVRGFGEGVVDVGTLIGSAFVNEETRQKMLDFIKEDVTGYSKYNQKLALDYSGLDKDVIAKGLSDITNGIVRMTPLILANLVSGGVASTAAKVVGTGAYYSSMAGNSAEEALKAHPDINYGNLWAYTAGSTALEMGIESISGKFFGGSFIDSLFGYKGANKTWLKQLGLDFLSEGLEESVSELVGSMLYRATVDENAPLASFSDIVYAGLIGGLTGAVMTGGSILATPTLTTDPKTGTLVIAKDLEQLLGEKLTKSAKLSKGKSYNAWALYKAASESPRFSAVTQLQQKYHNLSLEQIKEQHADEYDRAFKSDEKTQHKYVDVVTKLGKILNTIGQTEFTRAVELLNNSYEKATVLIDNYNNRQAAYSARAKSAQALFNAQNPDAWVNIPETLTTNERNFVDTLSKEYGLDAFFVEFGSENGVDLENFKQIGKKIFIKKGTLDSISFDDAFNRIVKQQLVNKLMVDISKISPKMYSQIMQMISERPDIEYNNLTSEQKRTIAQMMLFDSKSIEKVFYQSKKTFSKTYDFIYNKIEQLKNKKNKSKADKLEFRELLNIRNEYIAIPTSMFGSVEDLDALKAKAHLTDEQFESLVENRFMPSILNEYYILSKDDCGIDAMHKMMLIKELITNRVDTDLTQEIDWDNITNPNYYVNDFVEKIKRKYPAMTFEDGLWEYISDEYQLSMSVINETFYGQVDLVEELIDEVRSELNDAVIANNAENLKQYTNVNQLFNEDFVARFDNLNAEIIWKNENRVSTWAQTIKSPTGTKIVVHLGSSMSRLQEALMHEVGHVLALSQGIPFGTSQKAMLATLQQNATQDQIMGLAELMIPKPDLREKLSYAQITDAVAYRMYYLNIGEVYARGGKDSYVKFRDGFSVTDGGYVVGHGRYSRVNGMMFALKLAMPDTISEITYARNAGGRFAKFLDDKGITNLQEAGFSEEAIKLIGNSTPGKLWDLLIKDDNDVFPQGHVSKVGTLEATNLLISFLAPKNQFTKTFTDAELARYNIADTIAYHAYLDVQMRDAVLKASTPEAKKAVANDPLYRKDAPQKIDSIVDVMNNDKLLSTPVKNPFKRGPVTMTLGELKDFATQQVETLLEREENKPILKELIQKDFDYSKEKTDALLTTLSGYGIDSKRKIDALAPIVDSESGKTAIDFAVDENIPTPEDTLGEDEEWSYEKEFLNMMLKSRQFSGDKLKTYWKKLAKSSNPIINTMVDVRDKTGKKTGKQTAFGFYMHDFLRNHASEWIPIYGKEKFDVILDATKHLKKDRYVRRVKKAQEALQNKENLTQKQQELLSVEYNNFTPKQFREYIDQLELAAGIENLKALVPVDKQRVKLEQEVKELKEQETLTEQQKELTTIDTQALTTEQLKDLKTALEYKEPEAPKQEIKQVESAPVVMALTVATDSLTGEILSVLDDAPEGLSATQLMDDADKDYVKISRTFVHNNIDTFSKITDENYLKIRQELTASNNKAARQALTLFNYYTLEFMGRFNKETQLEIQNYNRKRQTAAAQEQAMQSKRVRDRKPATSVVAVLGTMDLSVDVTEDMVWEILGEDNMIDKDAKIKELSEQIKQLEMDLYNAKQTGDELGQVVIEKEYKAACDMKAALQSDDVLELLDELLNTMGEEDFTKTMDRLLQVFNSYAKPRDKEYFIYAKDKTQQAVGFEKLKKKMRKALSGAKQFRMWCMLSSPVTFARNWIGNKTMQGLDAVTDFVERLLAKTRLGNKTDPNDLIFNVSHGGKELYDTIKKKHGDYLLSRTIRNEEDRYDLTGQQYQDVVRTRRKKQVEKGSVFRKVIAGAALYTDWGLNTGMFGDEPILLDSLCKNLGNLIVSNKEWCLKGIENELIGFKQITKPTEEQSARIALLEKALNTKKPEDIFDAIGVDGMEILVDAAKTRSFEQYFKNPNAFSTMMSNMAKKNPIAAEVISWIMPFPKVAANVLKMAYKYSPLNFISVANSVSRIHEQNSADFKGRRDYFAQSRLMRDISTASVGTFAFVLGCVAAAFGWIDVDDDDYMGPSVKIGDFKMGLSTLAPSMTVFSVGAAMIAGYKNDKNGMLTAMDVLYDNTLLGNFENLFEYGTFNGFIESTAINYFSQYIPAALKLVTKFSDWGKKDKAGTFFEKAIKTMGSYIPGVSHLVPNKVNPYTGERVTRSGSPTWWRNILYGISPVDIAWQPKTPLQLEAERLSTRTTGVDGSYTINEKSFELTDKEKSAAAKFRAERISGRFDDIVSGKEKVTVKTKDGKYVTTTYDKLTDEQKKNVLKNIYSSESTNAKIMSWIGRGNVYKTGNQEEYDRLKKLFKSTRIQYEKGYSKSKFVEV